MGDRPIGESAEHLSAVRDDDVPQEMDDVMNLVRGDLDAVRRLVSQARTGGGNELDAELDAVASAMQRELNKLGSDVQGAFTTVIDEVDQLRRPVDGGSAASPGHAGQVATGPAEIHVSSSSPQHSDVLENPPPNSLIVVDESVVYTTDELGRVIRAQAELTAIRPEQSRNRRAERVVKGRLPGDHAGHIIARILGGVGDSINLVPMEARRVNLGQYRTLERIWQRAISDGGSVEIDVHLVYEGDNYRPEYFEVDYATSSEWESVTILNTPSDEAVS